MINADLQSIGQPEPFMVRVFGTMNSPQVFAAFLVVGLLVCFRSQSKLRFLAAPFGFASLILTMSRSGWIALVAGTVYLCFYLTTRQRMQLIGVIVALGVLSVAAMQNSAVNDMLTKRLQSFSDTKNDDSLGARIQDYGTLFHMMGEAPFGAGIGSDAASNTGESGSSGANGGIASRDSTIMSVLLAMGWLGTLTFVIGIGLISVDVFLGGSLADPELLPARAILLALFAEVPLNNISAGPVAFLVWSAIGFCLAQRETVDEQSQQAMVRMRRNPPDRAAVPS